MRWLRRKPWAIARRLILAGRLCDVAGVRGALCLPRHQPELTRVRFAHASGTSVAPSRDMVINAFGARQGHGEEFLCGLEVGVPKTLDRIGCHAAMQPKGVNRASIPS